MVARGGRELDAFISYSHAADSQLAPALRLGLERLTKPWYRRRALAVYLDTSGLAVTPALWTTIAAALGNARYLVLLCSPEAAQSAWVDKEVRFWLEHRSAATILPVLTDGTWVWDEARRRVDPASTAVPPGLHEAFAELPRYLDLRWARTATDLALRNGRFRDCVAQLAAPITGRPKSEIEGEDVRQHRRTVRTAWAAASALALLFAVALVAAVLAKANGDAAVQQRDVATSRLLAAQSSSRQERDPQLATLLALAAGKVDQTDEAQAAMMRMTEHDKHVIGFLGGHRGIVETAAFSPDGTVVATAGPDDPVRLWDVATRTVVAELPAAGVSTVAFTPDGATLAVAEPEAVALWNVASRTLRTTIRTPAFSLGISADGTRMISGLADGTVAVFDLATSAEVARLPGLSDKVTAVALSPDGRLAAGGAFTGTGLLWDVGTGRELARTPDYNKATKGRVVFAPDGRTLAMSRDGGDVLLLSLPDRNWNRVQAHRRSVTGLVFVDNDTLVSSSIDGSVGRWSIPTSFRWDQYVVGPLAMTTGSVLAPDGKTVVSGNFDGTAVLWSLDGDWSTPVGSLGSATTAAVDPAGRRVAVIDQAGAAIEIVPTDGTPAFRLPATPRAVRLALDGDGHLAVGHADGTVTVRDGATGAVQRTVRAVHGEPIVSLAFSADGRYLAAGSFGGTATVWTTGDGAEYATIAPPAGVTDTVGEYTHVAFSPDGRTLAHSSLMGGLRLWDVETRTSRAELRGSSSIGTASLAFNATGDLLAQGGFDSKVVLWDPAKPQAQLAVLTGQTTAVFGLSFGPNGRLAAGTADNGGVLVWDVARRTQQALIRPGTTGTEPLFLPNSSALLIADSTGVHRYELGVVGLHDRLCALVGRDLTADEWNAYVVGREQQPLCAR